MQMHNEQEYIFAQQSNHKRIILIQIFMTEILEAFDTSRDDLFWQSLVFMRFMFGAIIKVQ